MFVRLRKCLSDMAAIRPHHTGSPSLCVRFSVKTWKWRKLLRLFLLVEGIFFKCCFQLLCVFVVSQQSSSLFGLAALTYIQTMCLCLPENTWPRSRTDSLICVQVSCVFGVGLWAIHLGHFIRCDVPWRSSVCVCAETPKSITHLVLWPEGQMFAQYILFFRGG